MTLLLVLLALTALAGLGYLFAPKGWRTVVVNGLVGGSTAIVAVLDLLAGYDFSAIMTPENAAGAMLYVNVLNVVLRAITTSPLGRRY